MNEIDPWLLDGPPWVEYRTRLDLLGQSEDDQPVRVARKAMLESPQICSLLNQLAEWPGPVLKSHKSAGHLLHKLTFVADLGLLADDPGMPQIIQRILDCQSPKGPFQVLVNIKPRYGGTGEDQLAWMLCDAPLVTYALVKFGLGQTPQVLEAVAHLTSLIRENGWPCGVSSELGKFRGPGRKADPCPYANLVMLKLLLLFPEKHTDPAVQTGAEAILSLWDQRKDRRPYLFAMGTVFAKLKAPLVWYDILHITDVLTQIHWLQGDKRLLEMVSMVRSKADLVGRITAESVWRDWKEWGFGQKRSPSPWLTLLTKRMLTRYDTPM